MNTQTDTARHSPAPWHLGIRLPGSSLFVYDAQGGEVADFDRFTNQRDENLANARLAIAAPDLLAALEDAEFLLRKAGQLAGPMQDSFNRSAADARAAIAKAKGGAS